MRSPDGVTIPGHPEIPLVNAKGDVIQMITVCAECGAMRSIIMLVGDRWYCSRCRAEGTTRAKTFALN